MANEKPSIPMMKAPWLSSLSKNWRHWGEDPPSDVASYSRMIENMSGVKPLKAIGYVGRGKAYLKRRRAATGHSRFHGGNRASSRTA